MNRKEIDQLLVKRAKSGDLRAFDMLVLKYQAKIISVSNRYVKDISIAEDIAQESFIKAYKSLQNFREQSAFYTWVYTIASNTAKNYLVSNSRKKYILDSDISNDESFSSIEAKQEESPEDLLLAGNLNQVINKSLEDLPEEVRNAILLRERDGLSYEQIAKVLKCPLGTVRSRIFRGREILTKSIKENFYDTDNKLKNYE